MGCSLVCGFAMANKFQSSTLTAVKTSDPKYTKMKMYKFSYIEADPETEELGTFEQLEQTFGDLF